MYKTWNEFWGKFILVDYHEDNPERWTAREKRAESIVSHLELIPGSTVLGLGCGYGFLEICLGRLGMHVTGIDRLKEVLDLARKEIKGEKVDFHAMDLRTLQYPQHSYDAIMIMDVLGLMSKEEDAGLISNAAKWLKPGGKLIITFPKEPDEHNKKSSKIFANGEFFIESYYEPSTRIQKIIPTFKCNDGSTIKLMDPYDPDRGMVEGVLRYLYPFSEISALLRKLGLIPEEIEHFGGPGVCCVMARKEES